MPTYFEALDPAVILEAAWAAWLTCGNGPGLSSCTEGGRWVCTAGSSEEGKSSSDLTIFAARTKIPHFGRQLK